MPDCFGDDPGGFGRESDLGFIARVAPVDRPGVAEVAPQVEILRNACWFFDHPQGFESGDAERLRRRVIDQSSDDVPRVLDETEPVGMELQPDWCGLIRAFVVTA